MLPLISTFVLYRASIDWSEGLSLLFSRICSQDITFEAGNTLYL